MKKDVENTLKICKIRRKNVEEEDEKRLPN